MTTHRIEADKVVVEDDRRVAQEITWPPNNPTQPPFMRRSKEYNYSQPHKIIYVPVELPSGATVEKVDIGSKKRLLYDTEQDKNVREVLCPFHPDDTLILQFQWVKEYVEVRQPPATMPDHLGQQYKVVKTLGVEQLPDHVFEEKKDWPWHFKLLVEVANDHTQN